MQCTDILLRADLAEIEIYDLDRGTIRTSLKTSIMLGAGKGLGDPPKTTPFHGGNQDI